MSDTTDPSPSDPRQNDISRRGLLTGAGVAGVFALGVAGVVAADVSTPTGTTARIDPLGAHQAGVGRPEIPQQHCLITVLHIDTSALAATLRALGEQIVAVTSGTGLPDLTPDGPGDLTATVGLGPAALGATAHPELAELVALPAFVGDDALPDDRRGGDLLLSMNASDPSVLEPVTSWLCEQVIGARVLWSQFGYRGAPVDGVGRNPFGYFDGIIVPRGEDELQSDVWIADGPLAGGTICVVRRFGLDASGFRELPPGDRDAVVGREQVSGAPLSGGSRDDQVDLDAKAPDGTLLVPLHAHARAAHPSFTGSPLMLRRSYSYRDGELDHGHVFISYQNDVQTFVRTQLRLDETDAMMRFATPNATAAFAVLPGFTAGGVLGATLA